LHYVLFTRLRSAWRGRRRELLIICILAVNRSYWRFVKRSLLQCPYQPTHTLTPFGDLSAWALHGYYMCTHNFCLVGLSKRTVVMIFPLLNISFNLTLTQFLILSESATWVVNTVCKPTSGEGAFWMPCFTSWWQGLTRESYRWTVYQVHYNYIDCLHLLL
jgi:hypothetical protein